MKKGKVIKSVTLVSLSSVLAFGVAMAATGCGKSSSGNTLVVEMFCEAADKATNQQIADAWAEEYNAAHGTSYSVEIRNNNVKTNYYKDLGDHFGNGTVGDVIYLAPRNVKTYSLAGKVVDLTPYINDNQAVVGKINDVWSNALSFYGYDTSSKVANDHINPDYYQMGQKIEYKADGADGAGFYTEADKKVGLYGLPKDYSNFSMGYNRNFFTDEMKKAYTTTKVDAARNVKGATGATGSKSAQRNYTADTGKTSDGWVATYAVTVTDYDNPYTETVEHETLNEGQAANIINVGVPVNYKPFNFFSYDNYQAALDGGDPIAKLVETFTEGAGYTVTIPGFPDDTFVVTDETKKDPNADYDTSIGHMVYTYAEYGALQWALTYYLNTFAWDNGQNPASTEQGYGGKKQSSGDDVYNTVYGGEQYEGGAQDGAQLYLLPWLYSNDADLLSANNQNCTNYNSVTAQGDSALAKRNWTLNASATGNINITSRADWKKFAGDQTDTVKKLRLDGTYDDVEVQYGLNSQRFIETYGAFLAIGSDWNGNPGDTEQTRPNGESGWTYFRAGRSLFYGAGSWDPATRNEEDRAFFNFGQMAAPVAEKYALYSSIKGANYEMVTYSNYALNETGTPGVNGVQASSLSEGLKKYTKSDIEANLFLRQDKWGARMDSVGYAVTNKAVRGGTERAAAAAALCIALTISEEPQVTLTYAGAQLPNFRQQCLDLLNYQDPDYANGAFKDMIGLDGDAAKNDVWDDYYKIAKDMAAATRTNGSQTVEEYLAGKTVKNQPVKYDPAFAKTKLGDFAGSTKIAFAMKVLRMVAFTRDDLDLNIRMQYGLNAIRDSSMYTYDDTWLNPHDARSDDSHNLAYYRTRSITGKDLNTQSGLCTNPFGYDGNALVTPAVFCFRNAQSAQDLLTATLGVEATDILEIS